MTAFWKWRNKNASGESGDGESEESNDESVDYIGNQFEVTEEDERKFEIFEGVIDQYYAA